MEFGSGRAIEIAPFHSRGSLKGFVVSGRWPDSTKEWAQLLMVAVRVASLPGLLSTTTIFGVREELPEEPEPGTVGLVLAEGTVVGEIESTKSVGELFAPVDGEVVERNDAVVDDPSLVNRDPMGEAWLIKVRFTELPDLLSEAEYAELTAS